MRNMKPSSSAVLSHASSSKCKSITQKLTTTQIHRILSRNSATKDLYRGIFPFDLLPRYSLTQRQKPAIVVVNHGSSLTPGTHWTLIYFPKSPITPAFYFDSFGRSAPLWDLDAFIHRNSRVMGYTFNRSRVQDERSSSCGHFVIVTAWLLARGVNPTNIKDHFARIDRDCFLRNMIKMIASSYLMSWLMFRDRLYIMAAASPTSDWSESRRCWHLRTIASMLLCPRRRLIPTRHDDGSRCLFQNYAVKQTEESKKSLQ